MPTIAALLMVAATASAPPCDDWSPQPPAALIQAEAARLSLRKARIEWSLENHYIPPQVRKQIGDPGLVILRTWDLETFHVFQAAGRDRLNRDLGDAAGVRIYRLDNDQPAKSWGIWGDRPVYSLADDSGYYWRAWKNLDEVQVYPGDVRGVKSDIRMLGALSVMPSGSDDVRILSPTQRPRAFCEQKQGGQVVVRMRTGNTVDVFWIDPQRDFSITRSQTFWSGKLRFESRSRLKRFGKIWFPEKVEFYRYDHGDFASPALIVRVRAARFNEPDLPDDLTPADIGISPNQSVRVFDRNGSEVGTAQWTGQRLVGLGEFRTTNPDELPRGLVLTAQPSSAGSAADETFTRPAVRVETRLTQWEKYTLDFIDRYQLNRQQAQQAWVLLRECQSQGQQVLTTEKRTIESIERLSARLAGAHADQRAALHRQIRQYVRRIDQRLDAIFEKRLKPGLERLPARAQRRAAEAKNPPAVSP